MSKKQSVNRRKRLLHLLNKPFVYKDHCRNGSYPKGVQYYFAHSNIGKSTDAGSEHAGTTETSSNHNTINTPNERSTKFVIKTSHGKNHICLHTV